MPTYLVRWPHLAASLISAEDEDHLQYLLDEVGDPGGCTWKVYDGPIWVNFQLPVDYEVKERADGRPATSDDIEIDDVSKIVETADCPMDLSVGEAHAGFELKRTLTEFAFPALAECFADAFDEHDGPPKEDAIKEAVKDDLRTLLQYEWRHRQLAGKSGDVPELMQQMGLTALPPELAKTMSNMEETIQSMGPDLIEAFIEDQYGGEFEVMEHAFPTDFSVAIIKPKEPFVRWLNQTRESEHESPYTLEQVRDDCTALLTAPEVELDDSFIEDHFSWIFEYELGEWMTDQAVWPKNRDLETFLKWFDVEVHSGVLSMNPEDDF